MKLYSSSYNHNQKMSIKYVMKQAGGENISPEFHWEMAPVGTKSFILAMVDHHPVASNWVHWLVINIPGNVNRIEEGASGNNKFPSQAVELTNSFGFKGYGGPQPPRGTGLHNYDTTLYALNVDKVELSGRVSEAALLAKIKPSILATATLTGLYER